MGVHAKRLAFLRLLLCVAAGHASAGTITCVPAAPGSGAAAAFNPIRKISIDEHARTVNMDIVRARTKDTETMGKMRGELLSMDENQSGEPIYVFNAIPAAGTEVMSLYRLFKASEWRLISAGVTFISKVPALRSVEPATVFDCKRSDMG